MDPTPSEIEFGALPRSAGPRPSVYGDGTFPTYPERFSLLDRSLWKPVSMNRHVIHIYSQLDGMCTSNGACGVMMAERSFRGVSPNDNPILAPEDLYAQHSKWGTGSTLGENLRTLVDSGVQDRDACPREWPVETGKWTESLRAENRMLEFVDLNADFDAVATALQQYRPCLIGVRWPGGGGHAVLATELVRLPKGSPPPGMRVPDAAKAGWAIRGPNSWGEGWGEPPGYTADEYQWLDVNNRGPLAGGWYTLTERQCADFGAYGCWAAGTSV